MDRAALVLPIGQFGGASGPVDDPDAVFPVRRGDRVWPLDAARFTVWAYSHGTPERPTVEPWTVAALMETLTANGVVDGERHLAALCDDGLAVLVDPRDATTFAVGHRLAPLLLALGEHDEGRAGYTLGLFDHPVTTIAGPIFLIWAWSEVEPDLWTGCRRLAEDAQAAGGDDPDLTDPARVLHGLLEALPGLLSAGAAYLDVAGS
ncbi:hypothetical protein GCM10010399_71560 [Dactylosporangium fulvum]